MRQSHKNMNKNAEDLKELHFPLLRSQSVQETPTKILKSPSKHRLQYKEAKKKKKQKQSHEEANFHSIREQRRSQSILFISSNEKDSVTDELRKLNRDLRKQKLEKVYSGLDIWKEKYSLGKKKKKENIDNILFKIEQTRLASIKKHQEEFLERQRLKKKNLQIYLENSLGNSHREKHETPKKIISSEKKKITKNSQIHELVNFQIKKMQMSEQKKTKIIFEIPKQRDREIKPKISKIEANKKQEKKKEISALDLYKAGEKPTKWETNNMYQFEDEEDWLKNSPCLTDS